VLRFDGAAGGAGTVDVGAALEAASRVDGLNPGLAPAEAGPNAWTRQTPAAIAKIRCSTGGTDESITAFERVQGLEPLRHLGVRRSHGVRDER
jgi:hypothetical protein